LAYISDKLLKSLREARQRKGLSQRALSAKSGVPQSHISKIESGAVDLRVSSLIGLARILDLELELVPKKNVPAVQSIVRSSANVDIANAQKRIQKEMEQYKSVLASLPQVPSIPSSDIEKLKKATAEIGRFKLDGSSVKAIESSRKALEKIVANTAVYQLERALMPDALETIKKAVRQMSRLRNSLVHQIPAPDANASIPAYRLDGEDDE